MEFRFNINQILPKRINKITHTLLPEGFRGDRREYNDCQRLLTRILDDIGEASAKAQRLNRTITNAIKLRDTDHIVYLMIDQQGNNGLGSVIGLLKTGSKSLFMFDENGYHYQLKPRCILDFYIHESRQRQGLGIELYKHMLAQENLRPIKLAIDRPSDKFMSFLMKHFGFSSVIPQNNKFVVFRGFFDDETQYSDTQINNRYTNLYAINQQENKRGDEDPLSLKNKSYNGKPISRSAYGRYAASRPHCSMADIIHNTIPFERSVEHSSASRASEIKDRPDSLNFYKDETADIPIEEHLINNIQTFENEIYQEQDFNDGIVVDNNLNDSTDVEVVSMQALDIQDENSHEKEENGSSPNIESKDTEGRLATGQLDLKFYHSPLW